MRISNGNQSTTIADLLTRQMQDRTDRARLVARSSVASGVIQIQERLLGAPASEPAPRLDLRV